MNKILIESTADGSHTLFIPEINEHYHSVNGALQESLHVFINAGLKQIPQKDISILEIGFGTGLNAYLTLVESVHSNKNINYVGIEKYPLSDCIVKSLNYSYLIRRTEDPVFQKIHQTPWEEKNEITEKFSLTKKEKDVKLLDFLSDTDHFDLIYYDAFAPDKQTDIWTQDIFDYLYAHTSDKGVLVTYCSKGIVKRMLKQSGYDVEKIAGPKGKREMLRAIKSIFLDDC